MLAGNTSSSSRSVRRIAAGARVSGTFGELQSNPNPNIKRRVKKRVFGNVIGAVDAKKYRVDFDNIGVLEVSSNRLRLEAATASLPPDVVPCRRSENLSSLPPVSQAAQDEEEEEAIRDSQQDFDEEEHLPPPAEEEEAEVAREDVNNEEESVNEEDAPAGADPNGRMPGQLDNSNSIEAARSYSQRKQQALDQIHSLLGNEVAITHRCEQIKWVVVEESHPPMELTEKAKGFVGFDLEEFDRQDIFAQLFLNLTFEDWRAKVRKLNAAVAESNVDKQSRHVTRPSSSSPTTHFRKWKWK